MPNRPAKKGRIAVSLHENMAAADGRVSEIMHRRADLDSWWADREPRPSQYRTRYGDGMCAAEARKE
jgi:hypothetical protein